MHSSETDAALALVTALTDIPDVAFHRIDAGKSEADPPPLKQTARPSQVLYVRMMKGMTPSGLRKIVEGLEGFKEFQHTKTFAKIYFHRIEAAAAAAERLWSETNIYAFYHHLKSDAEISGGMCTTENGESGSKTVHVQALDRDFADLYALFFELPGAKRIGYHKNYIYLCFTAHALAKRAVSHINARTGMKARSVDFEYAPHFTPGGLGEPCKTVRMNFITITPTEIEIKRVFLTRPGFQKLVYTSKKCWAHFATMEAAADCVRHFNEHTNIKVVFCNKLGN
ncbi:hypothetical protein BC830DRAFT_820303 [Chytriomyces sp. MP71]|nr:hypothetical protein BC830DRAFT_820303 [Chytriomyces sp. MP71]